MLNLILSIIIVSAAVGVSWIVKITIDRKDDETMNKCSGCKYEEFGFSEYPCSVCQYNKFNRNDMYVPKDFSDAKPEVTD